MDARETTTNNADLWARFFTDQWSAWLDPFGISAARTGGDPARAIAETAAADVASFVALFVRDPIEHMYQDNAPAVTRFVQETAIAPESVEIPPEFAYVPPIDTDDEDRAIPGGSGQDALVGAF